MYTSTYVGGMDLSGGDKKESILDSQTLIKQVLKVNYGICSTIAVSFKW